VREDLAAAKAAAAQLARLSHRGRAQRAATVPAIRAEVAKVAPRGGGEGPDAELAKLPLGRRAALVLAESSCG
jgi:hypothetical protein